MDIRRLKGDLNIAKGRLKQKLARLTGDKFQLTEGRQDEQMGRLQKRTAENRNAAEKTATEPRPKDNPKQANVSA